MADRAASVPQPSGLPRPDSLLRHPDRRPCCDCGAPDAPFRGEERTIQVPPGALRTERDWRCEDHEREHRRQAELEASIREWLTSNQLIPNLDAFLGHGYLELCLRAWPDATGERLGLAARWAIWTWIADDILDTELLTYPEVVAFTTAVGRAISGGASYDDTHPAVRPLARLAMDARMLMPVAWWRQFDHEMSAWLDAATAKLARYVRPGRVPSLRAYQTIRPEDGGMRLAAMWTELATGCIAGERETPAVQELLRAFSTVGCLANDLAAADDDVFTVVRALAKSEGVSIEQARARAVDLLVAERERWCFLCDAAQDEGEDGQSAPRLAMSPTDAEVVVDSPRAARNLDQFLRALLEWTETSTRYAPATVEGAPR